MSRAQLELLVATRKGLFTVACDERGQWSVIDDAFTGDHVSLVLHDPRDGRRYAALDHGHFGVKLHGMDVSSGEWSEITCPAYPDPPEDWKPSKSPVHGEDAPWSVVKIWELAPGGHDEPGTIWCGTLPGGLFRSRDHGQTWELIESLWLDERRGEWFGGGFPYAGIHSVTVDPRDSMCVTAAVSCGGVWHSEDGGNNFELHADGMRAEYMPPDRADDANIQDPHRLVRCPIAPDRMWVQHHNGVYRSDDAGRSWTELKPPVSGFGFAVASHPTDPDTAWFIPAIKDEKRIPVDGELCVTRTRDAGATFDVLRAGLPQQHAYDLVFRHALDVTQTSDESAAVLAFGSTTGNLFVSMNDGDQWQQVSCHLPPIHSVQFVSVRDHARTPGSRTRAKADRIRRGRSPNRKV